MLTLRKWEYLILDLSDQEELTETKKTLHNSKEQIIQVEIIILTVYLYKSKSTKYVRQKPIKLHVERKKSNLMIWFRNASLSEMDWYNKQKICKETTECNSVINQMDQLIN